MVKAIMVVAKADRSPYEQPREYSGCCSLALQLLLRVKPEYFVFALCCVLSSTE